MLNARTELRETVWAVMSRLGLNPGEKPPLRGKVRYGGKQPEQKALLDDCIQSTREMLGTALATCKANLKAVLVSNEQERPSGRDNEQLDGHPSPSSPLRPIVPDSWQDASRCPGCQWPVPGELQYSSPVSCESCGLYELETGLKLLGGGKPSVVKVQNPLWRRRQSPSKLAPSTGIKPAEAKQIHDASDAFLTAGPLAEIGALPPDLLAAFNAAIFCASVPRSIAAILNSGDAEATTSAAFEMFSTLADRSPRCREAIRPLLTELSGIRDAPFRHAGRNAANAHLFAIDIARDVLSRIKEVCDPDGYARCLTDESARTDPGTIRANFRLAREALAGFQFPDATALVSEITLEASKAAAQRVRSKETVAIKTKLDTRKELSKAQHSADSTMVNWFGAEYTFALGVQTGAVKALWEEWEKTGLGLHKETIRDAIDAERDNFRLDKAFRGNPAFGTMIKSMGDGRYRLCPPENSTLAD